MVGLSTLCPLRLWRARSHVKGALVDDSIVAVTREAAAISVEGDTHRLGSVQRGVRPEDEVKEATLVIQAASNLVDVVERKDSCRQGTRT